jgi:methylenetetrahydrofolate dehydrogenase (NADP+) / methenyltetrahydrofolate cyclohydrolase
MSPNTNGDATLIDGKATSQALRDEIQNEVTGLKTRGISPGLAVVLVGEDPASQVYVRNKDRAAQNVGIRAETHRLPATTTQSELLALVDALNADKAVHGILVQLPLPKGLDEMEVVRRIDPAKDVDGLHPANVAALVMGEPGLFPCTPAGCIVLCDRYGIALEGKHAVVIGRSMLVGKPVAQMLLARNATVTIAHSRTANLAEVCRSADVIIAAVGRLGLVRGDWVKPGAAVIDVGINRKPDGKLAGDVAFDEVADVAGAVTPVPGGVGPMTIALLLSNTVLAAKRQAGL